MRKLTLLWSLLLLLILLLAACGGQEQLPYVQLGQEGQALPTMVPGEPARAPLRVAVAAVISPGATLDSYGPLLDYLALKLDRPVQLIQRGTYAEINDLIRSGGSDLAFVCGGAYVEGERDFGMELLVAPQVEGQTVYYSYVIVSDDSPVQSLADLRGHSFAFSDPLSNSGHLAPRWLLHEIGETPETFFDKTIFTYSHDNSIQAVADHLVAGAAVDSLVYDYLLAQGSTYATHTRIIDRAGPYGIPPVVVHPEIDPALRETLRTVLLEMDATPPGQAILAELRIDRFVEIETAAYDGIRRIAAMFRGWDD